MMLVVVATQRIVTCVCAGRQKRRFTGSSLGAHGQSDLPLLSLFLFLAGRVVIPVGQPRELPGDPVNVLDVHGAAGVRNLPGPDLANERSA